jgi:uncharacterized protein YecE (DUF72 family)
MGEVYIGTSGWSYKEWVGVFYPKEDVNKLSYYSSVYRTAEIDSTFYSYPTKGVIYGCVRYTPPDFVFSVKLPRVITHDKRLDPKSGVRADLVRFLDLLKPMADARKLGPLLIQLPPSFSFERNFENLREFCEIIPRDLMFAAEFRNKSWLRDETWDLLKAHNVANTIVDEPLLPSDLVVTADFSFVRWHGHGRRPWYNYRYSDKELEPWVDKLDEVTKKAKKTFGYFNNHFHGFAVENSLKMLQMLGASTEKQNQVLKEVSSRIEAKAGSREKEISQRVLSDF